MRLIAIALAFGLMGCTVETFESATADVNADFQLGKQLRDRCNATGDVDDCLAWRNYRVAEEANNPGLDYDAALDRWTARGPY